MGMCPWISGVPPVNVKRTKLIVAGTRTFRNYKFLEQKLNHITFWFPVIEVVVGTPEREEHKGEWRPVGVDALVHIWAEKYWWPRTVYDAKWYTGLSAGPKRNLEMAQYVGKEGYLVAFWNGRSPGTKSMIEMFTRYCDKSKMKVVRI